MTQHMGETPLPASARAENPEARRIVEGFEQGKRKAEKVNRQLEAVVSREDTMRDPAEKKRLMDQKRQIQKRVAQLTREFDRLKAQAATLVASSLEEQP